MDAIKRDASVAPPGEDRPAGVALLYARTPPIALDDVSQRDSLAEREIHPHVHDFPVADLTAHCASSAVLVLIDMRAATPHVADVATGRGVPPSHVDDAADLARGGPDHPYVAAVHGLSAEKNRAAVVPEVVVSLHELADVLRAVARFVAERPRVDGLAVDGAVAGREHPDVTRVDLPR